MIATSTRCSRYDGAWGGGDCRVGRATSACGISPNGYIPTIRYRRSSRHGGCAASCAWRHLGIAREKTTATPGEPNDVGPVGVAVTVEGVRGKWRVDQAHLDRVEEPFEGRAALLSPLDHLVFDRKRMAELFDFDYILEMYKPVAKRRWGYWAMPILYGDELVGKLDVTADRKAGVLRVNAIHPDTEFTPAMEAAIMPRSPTSPTGSSSRSSDPTTDARSVDVEPDDAIWSSQST